MQVVAPYGKTFRDALKVNSVKIVGLGVASAMLVMSASAAIDLNATIGPLLTSITLLIPSIIELIVSIVPAIIVMAIVGFIVGFLDKILSILKF